MAAEPFGKEAQEKRRKICTDAKVVINIFDLPDKRIVHRFVASEIGVIDFVHQKLFPREVIMGVVEQIVEDPAHDRVALTRVDRQGKLIEKRE